MYGLISGVKPRSLAEAAEIKIGEKLLSINGAPVKDIIELSFAAADYTIDLEIENAKGESRSIHIEKAPDEDLGLEFESAVFDRIKECYNKCVFCFVDQMIPGMRKGLYVRDDDYRLSFLYGNFVTLTNMKDEDFDRIIHTHLTPLYVSVHATDPVVRCKMMNNRFAGQLMERIHRLVDAGIQIHCQIVCCPGYNDGKILEKSFYDLYELYPGVQTMAVVPVGITKNREKLAPMRGFTKDEAASIVDMATKWQKKCRKETGTSFIHLGDEFYLLAEKAFPPNSWYDGFPQLENGIGLTRNFLNDWAECLKTMKNFKPKEDAVIPIGEGAYKVLAPLMDKFNKKFGSNHAFICVKNEFFGGRVNVTGLLTAQDILKALPENKHAILPAIVLNTDKLFLDDSSYQEFKDAYKGRVSTAETARELLTQLVER
ncbi:MAG: DUF512 domain-containing protein [Phascolarctobacterium sp.]|nr:DUF512 domain-containing protein [Phascolarctobacterium sp.]